LEFTWLEYGVLIGARMTPTRYTSGAHQGPPTWSYEMKWYATLLLMLVSCAAFFWLAPYAGRLGDVWQDSTFPRQNVTVEFRDGSKVTGTYHVKWNGEATLKDGTGRIWPVLRNAYASLSLPSSDVAANNSHWRASLPLSLLLAAHCGVLITLWFLYRPTNLFPEARQCSG
jgi:hypothetical protein